MYNIFDQCFLSLHCAPYSGYGVRFHRVLQNIEQRIKGKIEEVGIPLKDWNIQINYGIKTGLNEAFIISGTKKNELIAKDPKSAEIIRPILRGRDIKRYGYDFADLWLITTHNGSSTEGLLPIDINNYPAVKAHLDNYYDLLENRFDKGDTPYNLRSCAYMDDFYKQKVVWGNLCFSAEYAMVKEEVFINAPSTMIVPGTQFLLAILNSKLADWFIRTLGVTRNGGYFEYKPMFVQKLPVPIVENGKRLEIEKCAQSLQQLKKGKKDTSMIENEIDELVFNLYGLSEGEKKYLR